MSRFCNRNQRQLTYLRDDNYVESFTPRVDADDVSLMTTLVKSNVAPGYITLHAGRLLIRLTSRLNFYEGASTRGVLSCQLTHESYVLARPDITDASNGRCLAIVRDATPENRELLKEVLGALRECARSFGMEDEDSDLFSVYALYYPHGTGIGTHADGNPEAGKTLWMMRMIIGLGASRKVTFAARRYTKDPSDPKNDTRVIGVRHELITHEGGGVYLTAPQGSGRQPLCFTSNGERVFAMHDVSMTEDEGDSIAFVVDFPLRTAELKNAALAAARGKVFPFCRGEHCTT